MPEARPAQTLWVTRRHWGIENSLALAARKITAGYVRIVGLRQRPLKQESSLKLQGKRLKAGWVEDPIALAPLGHQYG